MAAGYSKKSLVSKLGIKDGMKIAIVGPPKNFGARLGRLPSHVTVRERLQGRLDFVYYFCKKRQDLESKFARLLKALSPNGLLWVSWPKGSSNVKADLNENVVRAIGLKHGLVDVKVCAVDETWSGLKFVRRLKDRT